MFAYIKGNIEYKANTYVVIETAGVGYKIFMSAKSIEKIGEIGQKVKVHTYYYVREDNISLYGFITNEELRMFELLLSVSGIGAKSAISMLSEITPSKFALAVISNDVSEITKVPGIGKKTAARLVLELKDKLKTETAIEQTEETVEIIKEDNKTKEAISALQVLGYGAKEITEALKVIDINGLELEDIIRQALKVLSK